MVSMQIHDAITAYQILGVPVGSDQDTCKAAYHTQCKKYHPDNFAKDGTDVNTGELLSKVLDAYQYLENNVWNRKQVQGKIIGNVPRKQHSARDAQKDRLLRQARKQKEYEELKKKAERLKQEENEKKILDQIRWIRLTDLIRQSMEADARKAELTKKAQDAIRKARDVE